MSRRTQDFVSAFFIISTTGLSPSLAALPIAFIYDASLTFFDAPSTPALAGLGSSPFARRYSGNHLFIFFSFRYLDVSVP